MLYLIKACYVLIFLSGLFLVCAALFLYEDEQGKVQSVLEDLWLKMDDNRNKLLSRHAAFMRVVAEATDSIFDRLLGKKLFSMRALFSLYYFSYASFWLTFSLYVFVRNPRDYMFILPMALSFLYVMVGAKPAITKKPPSFTNRYVGSFILLGVILPLPLLYRLGDNSVSVELLFYFTCAMGLGIMSDMLFIVLTRRLLRWSAGLQSFYKITAVVFLNCLVAFVLVCPLFLFTWIARLLVTLTPLNLVPVTVFVLIFVAAANSFTALTALFFVVLALIMLVHRLFWPVLERPIYALQRVGIARRSKLLGIIGIILMGLSLGIQPTWLKDIMNGLIP
jgi:hypothetical protein